MATEAKLLNPNPHAPQKLYKPQTLRPTSLKTHKNTKQRRQTSFRRLPEDQDLQHVPGRFLKLRFRFGAHFCSFLRLYYTILYYTILYYAILYYTTLCYAMLYCCDVCYTMLYSVMPDEVPKHFQERPKFDEVPFLGLPTTRVAAPEVFGGRFSVNVTLDFGVTWPSAMRIVRRKGKSCELDAPPKFRVQGLGFGV